MSGGQGGGLGGPHPAPPKNFLPQTLVKSLRTENPPLHRASG
ncbi:mobile element protein [Microcystis aeruginosa NIES-44]|uniref:Mobile element protein n=1 Tax=Microcystis aeruginosa NIES-44 TaxID=449439 RepID=A0A0A1VUZ6_MICAE|nr:mobile element protein [Microcystis aeruginosa NIES-44]